MVTELQNVSNVLPNPEPHTLPPLQAEARAEFAERSVTKLQKEVDRLEGEKCF